MTAPFIISAEAFEQALASADDYGRDGRIAGLGAPLGAAIHDVVGKVWDKIRYALRTARQLGAEAAAAECEEARTAAEIAVREAGNRAREIHTALMGKMRAFSNGLMARALAQVEPTIDVGGVILDLADVTLARRFVLGGSIRASITELVALSASGEFNVEARYVKP